MKLMKLSYVFLNCKYDWLTFLFFPLGKFQRDFFFSVNNEKTVCLSESFFFIFFGLGFVSFLIAEHSLIDKTGRKGAVVMFH